MRRAQEWRVIRDQVSRRPAADRSRTARALISLSETDRSEERQNLHDDGRNVADQRGTGTDYRQNRVEIHSFPFRGGLVPPHHRPENRCCATPSTGKASGADTVTPPGAAGSLRRCAKVVTKVSVEKSGGRVSRPTEPPRIRHT